MSEYFETERDDVPRYLGTIFRKDTGRWMLPSDTYHLKLYQPERDYEWKNYPNLGLVERRATFEQYGEPEIGSKYIPFENDLWNDVDYPFVKIVAAAIAEKAKANRAGVALSPLLVTDKEFLMSETEKVASGMFWHLKPECVATIVNSLVSKTIKDKLPFGTAPFVPVPAPQILETRLVSAGLAIPSDEETEDEIKYA
jgi:hypothetical protein